MKANVRTWTVWAVLAALVLPLGTGCDVVAFLQRVTNGLEGFVEGFQDDDESVGDVVDDILNDIEDWFD